MSNSFIFECDFTDAVLVGANFKGLDTDTNIKFTRGKVSYVVSGRAALGYLSFSGALTDEVEDYYVWVNHARYSIVEKIIERISEQRNSQLRGLTQRGEARIDVPFSQAFIKKLESMEVINIDGNDLVSVTAEGRTTINYLLSNKIMHTDIASFLRDWRV